MFTNFDAMQSQTTGLADAYSRHAKTFRQTFALSLSKYWDARRGLCVDDFLAALEARHRVPFDRTCWQDGVRRFYGQLAMEYVREMPHYLRE